MKITLPDGSVRVAEQGVSAKEIVKGISEGLYRNAVAVEIDGKEADLNTVLDKDCSFKVLTFADEKGKEIYRHSCAHVMAQAVKNLYPTAKLAIGPSIKNGFYYDVEFEKPISQDDLVKIEEEMKQIVKKDYPFVREIVGREEASKIMAEKNETYKTEMLSEMSDETVSLYHQGDFVDMCRGPHVPSTGRIKAFRLTSLAGAYWRGDEHNKMLTRIYGTAFDKKSELDEYLEKVENAKKNDHNKIGRELGFFMTDELIGQGLPLMMPRGARVIQNLQRFVEDEEERRGYLLTKTPFMAKRELYKKSGHWDHYRDGMFVLGDPDNEKEECLALRPMTCPFQFTIYKNGLKSYKDLPLRYGETSTLFRNESSGEMHGLIRVRQFTISEGHLVVRPDQLEEEFLGVLDLVKYMLTCLGMQNDVTYRFSKWDPKDKEKYIDDPEAWENSQKEMKRILDKLGLTYYEAEGEAAFYGPKLDIQTTNVYGKEDTMITIQIDFELAKRFDMVYVDQDGKKKYPFIIHRTSMGCYERTLALLIEKYAGALPLWVMDEQVRVMSLSERTESQVVEIAEILRRAGIRVKTDMRSEKIGYKIREAQQFKIPYMLIIGDKEAEAGLVSVRKRKVGDLGQMSLDEFIAKIKGEIDSKDVEG